MINTFKFLAVILLITSITNGLLQIPSTAFAQQELMIQEQLNQ